MMNLKIGIISDLHLFNKTLNAQHALSKLRGIDLLLIVGDVADRAEEKQYGILLELINEYFCNIPVYCVSGNHDNPAKDDTNYRNFERQVNGEYPFIVDECGAFYKNLNEHIDIIGLNPTYHQKQFFFPDKGHQLAFLQEKLSKSPCDYHIIMCHPPLIAHNPQRTVDMAPYIVEEQDKRLQRIIDESNGVIFVSGHTHFSPTVEPDKTCRNLYINNGSICPTTVKDSDGKFQQGNVTVLEIGENGISVTVKGIHTDKIFLNMFLEDLTYTKKC